MGLLAVAACLVCSGFGLVTAVIVFKRHGFGNGGGRLIHAVNAVLGSALVWAWVVAVLGLAERQYTSSTPTVWILGAFGAGGLVLIGTAFNAALKPNHHRLPGHCRACGYDMNAMPDAGLCPECGGHAAPSQVPAP